MDTPIVTTKQGKLRGRISSDIDGGQIIEFLGVPFAKPPVSGELRFKAPQPAEPWDGVRDATEEGNVSYARDMFFGGIGGSEDCLNLNIFTRNLPGAKTSLKPVMFWIHGGGFTLGSNRKSMYGPNFLLTEDIVLVATNYRLGALGFLSAEDESLGVPGNAGLKDQALALRWVQENIKSFNGDPNNVTIFGESAGSGSVHYHVLSPTTKGLFHKAVMQSGSTLNYWAVAQPAVLALAKVLGHEVDNEREALDILKNASVEALHEAQEKLDATKVQPQKLFFAPVIEKPNETAFITEDAIKLISSGKYNQVPLMFGYTSREGLLVAVQDVLAGAPVKKKEINFEDYIPWQLGLERGSEASKQVCEKLSKFYLTGADDDEYVVATDSLFLASIMASVYNHSKTSKNPVYLFRMSLDAGLNALKCLAKLKFSGTCHADDVGYLFNNEITPNFERGSLEEISIKRFVKLWTNFARFGNPTPDSKELGITWKPVTEGNINFLDIGEELTVGVNPEQKRMELWREIFQLNPATANFL